MNITVGARELKTRLGLYLRAVRNGQTLVVTDRGAAVAELRPIEPPASASDARWRAAAAHGSVTLARTAALSPFEPAANCDGTVDRAVDASLDLDREDRF
jgi:prevent-host-death family protein